MPKFKESAAAHYYLDGLNGIEIGGAAHNDFNIANCLNVDYCNDLTTVYKDHEFEMCGARKAVDIVAYAWDLPFTDESLDYVLNSHVLEHCWDLIGTLKEWLRVIKPGGLIFTIFPSKDRTFDKDRPRTLLQELIDRHTGKTQLEGLSDQHHTVWLMDDALELCRYLKLNVIYQELYDDKVGNGFTFVIKK